MRIPLISFFTGGGFLDLGFEQAGFDIRWTNEHNPLFASIYSHGITSWRRSSNLSARRAEISSIESIEMLDPDDVLAQAFPKTRPALFGVIGGPPCTDFSNGGLHSGHDGDAGRMTSIYVRMLRRLRPSFFLLENVPNLASHPKHKAKFEGLLASLDAAGFSVVVKTLNALEYGIPQERRRLFVIGFRRELLRRWFPNALQPKRMLRMHWRWPERTHPDARTRFAWATTSAFGAVPSLPLGVPLDLCTWHAVCRQPEPETLSNGKDFFIPYSTKFTEIAEGDVSGKSFKRLHRYRYSPTAWYGNNEVHMHPFKERRLSVREALRLQTVPDSYEMPIEASLSSKFRVVGNGVPCRLAYIIAAALNDFVSENETRFSRGCAMVV